MESTLSQYSQSYCGLMIFVALAFICTKKDLGIFMKVGSIGVIFVFMLIIYIIVTGIVAFKNTEFVIGTAESVSETDYSDSLRSLTLIGSNMAPLAGILGLGYFLHTASLPIVRSAKNPELADRDMFLGYFFVFLTYVIIGSLGYIGFMGTNFSAYFIKKVGSDTAGELDQNCLSMFLYTDIAAFILRIAIFLLIFSTYPLIHFFVYQMLIKLFFGEAKVKKYTKLAFGQAIVVANLCFALFYPNIGTIMSYVGSVCGFIIIYCLPIMVYLA